MMGPAVGVDLTIPTGMPTHWKLVIVRATPEGTIVTEKEIRMGLPNRARGSFKNLVFPKQGKDIIEAAKNQRAKVLAKIEEREERIRVICKEKGLNVADFFINADQFYENATSALGIQAGELAQMREEAHHMTAERAVAKELTSIIDNLPDDWEFKLDFAELDYFGF